MRRQKLATDSTNCISAHLSCKADEFLICYAREGPAVRALHLGPMALPFTPRAQFSGRRAFPYEFFLKVTKSCSSQYKLNKEKKVMNGCPRGHCEVKLTLSTCWNQFYFAQIIQETA